MTIEKKIDQLLATFNREPDMPNVRAYLLEAAHVGAQLERDACAEFALHHV